MSANNLHHSQLPGKATVLAYCLCGLIGMLTTACSSHNDYTLMPTPVLYEDAIVNPFAHLHPSLKSNTLDIFYATNRKADPSDTNFYNNRLDSRLHLGSATVRLGDADLLWEDLIHTHFEDKSAPPLPVYLDSIREQAEIELKKIPGCMLTPVQGDYFAAIDVEADVFLERLPGIREIAEQVVVTVTDFDNALIPAKRFMGEDTRTGDKDAEAAEKSFILKHHLTNVEIIDVSHGQKVRGFDTKGQW